MFDVNRLPIINGYRYIITHHAREKMRERFGSKCNPCDMKAGNIEVIKLLSESKENKSIFNNTEFISNIYEKYGSKQRVKFLQHGSKVFIALAHEEFENCFVVVTCYEGTSSTKQHFLPKRRRF
jgi:hypothetical protein